MGWQANLPTHLELLAVEDPVKARACCEAHPAAVKDGYSVSKEMLISGAVQYTDQGFAGGALTGSLDVSSIMRSPQ